MKKGLWVVLLLVVGGICEISKEKLFAQALSKQEEQARTKADAEFDIAVKQAVNVTEDACYGQFIQVVVPSKNSTRQPVAVVFGTAIKSGEEDNYGVWGTQDSVVFVHKPQSSVALPQLAGMKILNVRPTKNITCP